jgi:hypothetical protein
MKSVVPPEIGLLKTLFSNALLEFTDFDNLDLKGFSKRKSSHPPGILLSWFFDFYKVPLTIS